MVLPQFPWIVDYEILEERIEPMDRDYYRINYFIFTDEDGTFTVTKDMEEVEELTKSLFKMLGPDKNQIFEGVSFYSNRA
jgi:hypothetical protein